MSPFFIPQNKKSFIRFYRILHGFSFTVHTVWRPLNSSARSRDLPLGRPGPTLGDRGGRRSSRGSRLGGLPAPALPSVVWVPPCGAGGRPPRRTPGTSGASGRPGGRGAPGAVWVPLVGTPSGRREPVLPWGTLATPAKNALGRRARAEPRP